MRKTIVELIDDLDQTVAPDITTHTFALNGTEYEIDLTPANARKLEKALERFCEAGRVTRRARGRRRAMAIVPPLPQEDGAELTRRVRAWARENGYEVADRGRVAASVLAAYRAAS